MNITILVVGYLLISALCTCALISACVISARMKDKQVRVLRAVRVRPFGRSVAKSAHAH
ncbi:MAG: hypothetical protein IT328_27545 [Caldilineaceae bacterium]|nr:hypothetical protein [Caldilineaceae bacterium]